MENKIKFMGILVLGLAIVLVALILLRIPNPVVEEGVKKFNNIDEIKSFLKNNVGDYGSYNGEVMATTAGAVKAAESSRAEDYSTTNIQVRGVDEADIVKNDDKYIYSVSGKKVVIVDAYPAEEMKILSEVDINKSISEIFINDNKLIIFASGYDYVTKEDKVACLGCGGYSGYKNFVYLYDISDRENPELENEIETEGNYIDSRMIDKYVYAISQKYINMENPESPVYILDGVEKQVAANEIYYFDYPDTNYIFTSIMAINVNNGETEVKTYLTGYAQNLYVSQDNIYLTGQKTVSSKNYFERYVDEVVMPLLPSQEKEKVQEILDSDKTSWDKMGETQQIINDYSNSLQGKEKENFDKELMEKLQDFSIKIQKEMEKTIVHKINIDGKNIEYKASGEVPGRILHQFSMDEYDGNFRIATTTGQVSRTGESTSLNHLYVLDKDLEVIGKVEDLAKGEKIYSTRFLGKRAYIVTFKKIDPLFVIDLSVPEKPEVLGYLKITGYSDYLHPYDENHIIGIGKETRGGNENFAWYQGLKVSLFDVSDVENPKEIGKIEIGDRGTDSYALQDHKAFLFDKKRNLLVLPVSLAEINESRYQGEIPDNAYGDYVWQGAYVLNIDLNGISLKGKITHQENQTEIQRWYYTGKYDVQRSLYMDDVLYTISLGKIKANSIKSLEEINSLDLPYEEEAVPIYSYG